MGREWSVLGEPDIKMYLVMSDSIILKIGDFMELLRKGNYVRVSHLAVRSVHHLAGIHQCQRSKATTSSDSGFSLNEFLPGCRPYHSFQV